MTDVEDSQETHQVETKYPSEMLLTARNIATQALHEDFPKAHADPSQGRVWESNIEATCSIAGENQDITVKRKFDFNSDSDIRKKNKMEGARTLQDVLLEPSFKFDAEDDSGPAPVNASDEGITSFNDYDVLSGRGGGTNVHPGNRNFRDLINLHRRAYLKARKNDKPAISRAIVRSIRENDGRFLRKDEASGMWFEIGDDAAREKTSQALRQRAPEMRKLLFDTEREEARAAAEEQNRQQHRVMMSSGGGMTMAPGGNMVPAMTSVTAPGMIAGIVPGMHPAMAVVPVGQPILTNPMFFQTMANGNTQIFPPTLLGQGMNQFTANGS